MSLLMLLFMGSTLVALPIAERPVTITGKCSVNHSDIEKLTEQLDVLTTVMASLVRPDLPLRERAPLLSGLGLNRNQIARVCGTSPEVISVRLAEAKRKGSRRNVRRRSETGHERQDG